jgi:hypothetical protein
VPGFGPFGSTITKDVHGHLVEGDRRAAASLSQTLFGPEPADMAPNMAPHRSHWACYRFAAKLREPNGLLTSCPESVLATLRDAHPEMGQTVAIDGSDMPAYANGHRHVGNKNGPPRTRFADPDAKIGVHSRTELAARLRGG